MLRAFDPYFSPKCTVLTPSPFHMAVVHLWRFDPYFEMAWGACVGLSTFDLSAPLRGSKESQTSRCQRAVSLYLQLLYNPAKGGGGGKNFIVHLPHDPCICRPILMTINCDRVQ